MLVCPYTGQPLEQKVKVLRCAKCDAELPPRMRFCPSCGEPAPGWEEAINPKTGALAGFSRPTTIRRPGDSQKKTAPWLFTLIAVLILAGAVLLGIYHAPSLERVLGLRATASASPTVVLPSQVAAAPSPAALDPTPTRPPTSAPSPTAALPTKVSLPTATLQQTIALPSATPSPAASPTPALAEKYARYDLAFISDRDQRWQVILMNSQNPQDWVAVPPPPDYEWVEWPTFCGGALAFEAEDRQLTQPRWVYFYDLAEETYQPLELADASVARLAAPSCSPSGQRMAYAAARGSKWSLQAIDRSSQQLLVDLSMDEYATLGFASWMMDEGGFYWMGIHYNGFTDVNYTTGLAGSLQTILLERGRYPAISPDGHLLAFFCGNLNHLCVIERKTGLINASQTIHYVKQVREQDTPATAAWSADGQWIYFTTSVLGNWDVYRMRPDGSGVENLTKGWTSDELMIASR